MKRKLNGADASFFSKTVTHSFSAGGGYTTSVTLEGEQGDVTDN
ncbi:MAG: hypothetical protein ABI454_00460 [Sphingomicrobium sp.]